MVLVGDFIENIVEVIDGFDDPADIGFLQGGDFSAGQSVNIETFSLIPN